LGCIIKTVLGCRLTVDGQKSGALLAVNRQQTTVN
jgi:hypothetical protein